MGLCHHAPRDVGLRIVAAWHLLHLAEDPGAVAHVVVEHLGGRGHRRIGEAQDVGVELAHLAEAQRIGLLVEGNGVFLARRHVAHDDAGQRILALHAHQPVLENEETDEEDARTVRHEIGPIVRRRSIGGRGDDLVVLGAAHVGLDDELVAPVLDVILDAWNTSGDEPWCTTRSLGVNHPHFRSVVIMDVDQDVLLGIGLADAGEHAGILFLVDENVVRLRRSQNMPIGLQRAVVVVLDRVEEALAIRRPHGATRGVLQDVAVVDTRRHIAHAQFVELRAIAIERPRREIVVR